jgi:hypothetical protein
MPWWKVDDSLYSHRKTRRVVRRSLEALGLWTLAGSYCARYGTDGRITPDELVELLECPKPKVVRLAEVLVDCGLWDRDGDAYVFHDWLQYNDTAAELKERRSAAAARQKRWRQRDELGRYESNDNANLDGRVTRYETRESRVSNAYRNASPVQTRPEQTDTEPEKTPEGGPPRPGGTSLSDDLPSEASWTQWKRDKDRSPSS